MLHFRQRATSPVAWPRRHKSSTMSNSLSEAVDHDILEELRLTSNDDREKENKIESWLDEHPEFFQEYLIRKGKLEPSGERMNP